MAVVVDTDVVSFVYEGDTRGALYDSHLKNEFMIVSFLTLAKLRFWSLKWNWGAKKNAQFNLFLRRYSIDHSTPELCQIWAEITHRGRRIGKSIAVADAWIAATALFFDAPLVTHNAADFQAVQNLRIITES
jgi:tRNA(fMet)-specific endonuclease VapC